MPGVGSYPGVEKSMSLTTLLEHKKPIINPYKFKRFSQKVSDQKQWVPGPGSYNIGPLPKIRLKNFKANEEKKPEEIKEEVKDKTLDKKKGKKPRKSMKPK